MFCPGLGPCWRLPIVEFLDGPDGGSQMEVAMKLPEVVSHEEWLNARQQLLDREKELTRQRDKLNADRRRLPMVRIDREYKFEGPHGTVGLLELFEDSGQLIVQHIMFDPDWDAACPSCTASMDESTPALLDHLEARDTSYVRVARAPYAKIAAYQEAHGWTFPWYSSYRSDFSYDFGVTSIRPWCRRSTTTALSESGPPSTRTGLTWNRRRFRASVASSATATPRTTRTRRMPGAPSSSAASPTLCLT